MLRRILCNIYSIPTFIVATIFLVAQLVHNFTTNSLKKYISNDLASHIQGSAGAINAVFVIEQCPGFYQPYYAVLVIGAQLILTSLSWGISTKLHKKAKARIVLIIFSYIVGLIGVSILCITMRSILFR